MVVVQGGGARLPEVLALAALPAHREVRLVCRDGVTHANSLVIRLISPLLATLLASTPEGELLLPDIPVTTMELLLNSLLEEKPGPALLSALLPVLRTLCAFQPAPTPALTCFPLVTPQPYFNHIPALPDIQSTELFDPEYLEDVEIVEEENLSLTIRSSEPHGGDGASAARRRRRKGAARVKRTSKSSREGEVEEGGDKTLGVEEGDTSLLTCSHCDFTATTKEELKSHTRLQHGKAQTKGRSPHICACGKSFKKLFQLANHQRIHSGDRPFVCHTCGKAFNQEATLRTHMRIHSGARPFKCNDCGEAFNATSALTAHRQWKHAEGLRPFLCSFCTKSFPTKAAVKKHETIHRPTERRHPCTQCNRRFARADHLKSHLRAHLPQSSTKPP